MAIDQENEEQQAYLERDIARSLDEVYHFLQKSDRPEAEEHLGHIAQMKAFWEGDAASEDQTDRDRLKIHICGIIIRDSYKERDLLLEKISELLEMVVTAMPIPPERDAA